MQIPILLSILFLYSYSDISSKGTKRTDGCDNTNTEQIVCNIENGKYIGIMKGTVGEH